MSGAAAAVPAVIRIRSGDRKMVRNMFETMDGDGDGDGDDDDDGGDDDGDDDGAIKTKIKNISIIHVNTRVVGGVNLSKYTGFYILF